MRNRHPSLSVLALVTHLAALSLPAQQPAADAGPSLRWEQLLTMPGLWPRDCQVTGVYRLGDKKIAPGTPYSVLELLEEGVRLQLPDGTSGVLPRAGTDVLSMANATFAAMKPGQLVIDLKMLTDRADLWPKKIVMRNPVATGEGESRIVYKAGVELDFGTFDGKWVRARNPDPAQDQMPALSLNNTDLVERVRVALAAKPTSGGHRVLQELDGKIFSLRTGKKVKLSPSAPPEYLVLFFSAGWCPGCRSFAPELVRFYQEHKRDAGKRFEIVWISRDRAEADMKQYAKTHEFPWLAVTWDKLGEIPVTQAHDPQGIPNVVLLNAKSALLGDSYVGHEYKGPEAVLAKLAELLKTPK